MSEEGFWNITETERPFVDRRHLRFPAAVRVFVSIHNSPRGIEMGEGEPESSNSPPTGESTMTINISLCGALIFSNLEADIGDCLSFSCDEPKFSALAIVRNRTKDGKTPPKLHLEFINEQFPVEKMYVRIEENEKN